MVDNFISQKDYPERPELLTEGNLDENTSLKKILNLIGEKKTVIDFGCATGYLAQMLTERGCLVTGVEINQKAAKVAEKYCTRVVVADLDNISLSDIFADETYDVAIFGDVLEHLRNPWRILKETRSFLTPQGYVVASIPNIAHGAIRLALLQGNFDYQEMGILDNTHLRFFTSKTVEELFEDTGYIVETTDRTKLPLFLESNLLPAINFDSIDHGLIEQLQKDKDIETLQFIVRALPASVENQYALLKQKYQASVNEVSKTQTELAHSQSNLEQTQTELAHSQSNLEQTKTELAHSQSNLEQTKTELAHSQSNLEQTQTALLESQSNLEQTQTKLAHSQSNLDQTQTALLESQSNLEQTKTELAHSQSNLEQTQTALLESQSNLEQTQTALLESQSNLEQTQTKLAHSQSNLEQTQTKLAHSQSNLEQTQTELLQSQSNLEQTQTELAHSQSNLEQTQTELLQSQSNLEQTQTELTHSQTNLEQTQTELTHSQTNLEQTQTELTNAQTNLEHAQTELTNAQTNLKHSQVELQEAQNWIVAMESSKFWKIRKLWFRLKYTLKLDRCEKNLRQ